MRLGLTVLALAVLLGIGAAPAAASIVTFDFTGEITAVAAADPFGGTICDGSNCAPATTFTGSFTFDSTTPNSIASLTQGSYQHVGPPFGLTVTIGGNVFSTTDFVAINIQDSPGFDFYGVLACTASLSPPACSPVLNDGDLSIELSLSDFTGTALGSNALPLTPPSVAALPFTSFLLQTQIGLDFVELDGIITSLSCSAGCTSVPGPETGALVMLGAVTLAGVAGRCRRAGARAGRR